MLEDGLLEVASLSPGVGLRELEIEDLLIAWPEVPMVHFSNLFESGLEDKFCTSPRLEVQSTGAQFLIWKLQA
jgi:hypothetical protein